VLFIASGKLIVAGTIFRVPAGFTPLDHTSILETIEQRWGLPWRRWATLTEMRAEWKMSELLSCADARREWMNGNRWWVGASVMLVALLQARAAILPHPAATASSTSTASTAPRLTVFGIPQQSKTATISATKLDGSLRDIAQRYPTLSTDHPVRDLHQINPAARFRLSAPLATPEVLIDAITTGDPQTLKSSLQKLGLRDAAVFSNDVGGWLPVDQLANAGALAELHFARAAMPRTRSSVVATQGDFVQTSSAVRTAYPSLTGAGVTVGVLSDSFNCFAQYANSNVPASGNNGYAYFGFTATYADDQQPSSGEAASTSALPAGVNVIEEANCMNYGAPEQLPFTDEGRAILQIIHAVAPGAGLAFYTAIESEADFANGILKLTSVGAQVIDDDVGYPDEPFFQNGLVAQAINTVAAQGVVYFSSAGNDGVTSYENTAPSFPVNGTGSQATERLLNFDPSGATTTTTLPLSIPALFPGEFIFLVVEWDQPYVTGSPHSGGATSSIDMCVSGAGADLVTTADNNFGNPVSCSGASQVGGDPVQILIIGNPASASGNTAATPVSLSIGLAGGTQAPERVKFLLSANGAAGATINSFAPGSPTIQGHPGAATAAAVGAAFFFYTPQCGTTPATLETYSSEGGDPTLFDSSGNRLTTPELRQKPDFVGPDGVNNTMLGGTLVEEKYPDKNNATNTLPTSIAACQNNSSFPNFLGTSAAAPHPAAAAALMLQANPALTPAQIIQAMQSTALPMTPRATSASGYDYDDGHGFVQIEAALAALPASAPTISVSPTSITKGSSATLTWNAINSSGCTAAGSWSGSQSASGSQTVTPTAAGTSTYTLTCTGADGSMSSSATLTVTSPSHGGGGGLDGVTLLALGAVLLAGRLVRRDVNRRHFSAALTLSALSVALLASSCPLQAKETEHEAAKCDKCDTSDEKESPRHLADESQTTQGSITIGGHKIVYQAEAGILVVHQKDPLDEDPPPPPGERNGQSPPQLPEAGMSYVAYFQGDHENPQRPITFLFNGGPGSSTVWLHMGAFGPKRVLTANDTHSPAAPYKLVDNEYSLLDASDLVFVDAPGTGFSHLRGADKEKAFYGVDEDAHAFANFILEFLSRHGRWNSPKYLFGESYGTARASVLAYVLENEKALDLNGVILLSAFLCADDSADGPQYNPGVDQPYVLALPTYAATAWYHHKLPNQPQSLEPFLTEVEQFALGEYWQALMAGNTLSAERKSAVAAKLHEYTGLPAQYIEQAGLRINGGEFEKTLLGSNVTTGRLDSRFTGPTLDPMSKEAEYDPQSAALSSAYVSAFNDYVRRTLKFGNNKTYKAELDVEKQWDFLHQPPGATIKIPQSMNVMLDLATAMKLNPNLKVQLNGGYFDLATPFFTALWELQQLPMERSLLANTETHFYRSGHMVYAHEPDLKALHDNAAAFIGKTH
jgi:carboxypeptidase C (cathepsin A)